MVQAVASRSWSHGELLAAIGGAPFLSRTFAPDALLYFVARLRAELAGSGAGQVGHFLAPEVAVELYQSIDPAAARRPESRAMTVGHRSQLDAALAHIVSVKPGWQALAAIPLEFRLLLDAQVSSTNPLLPQVVYLGQRAFASPVVLQEVLVHELSHVWFGFLCEITDFQLPGGPDDLVLPSGTRGKNSRQVIFAATFAAAVVDFYATSGGAEAESPHAARMAYCLEYLRKSLLILEREAKLNEMGRLIDSALRDFARRFP